MPLRYDLFAGRAVRRLGGRSPELPYRTLTLPLGHKLSSAIGRVDYVRVMVRDGLIEPLATSGASILSLDDEGGRLRPCAARQRGLSARRESARVSVRLGLVFAAKREREPSMRQDQFLDVIDRDEAERRFRGALDLRPLDDEEVSLGQLLARVLRVTLSPRSMCRVSIVPMLTGMPFGLRTSTDAVKRNLLAYSSPANQWPLVFPPRCRWLSQDRQSHWPPGQ